MISSPFNLISRLFLFCIPFLRQREAPKKIRLANCSARLQSLQMMEFHLKHNFIAFAGCLSVKGVLFLCGEKIAGYVTSLVLIGFLWLNNSFLIGFLSKKLEALIKSYWICITQIISDKNFSLKDTFLRDSYENLWFSLRNQDSNLKVQVRLRVVDGSCNH